MCKCLLKWWKIGLIWNEKCGINDTQKYQSTHVSCTIGARQRNCIIQLNCSYLGIYLFFHLFTHTVGLNYRKQMSYSPSRENKQNNPHVANEVQSILCSPYVIFSSIEFKIYKKFSNRGLCPWYLVFETELKKKT